MRSPEDRSKEQLIQDLIKLRNRINELEKIEQSRKKYEKELVHTKAMYEGLFEFAPDAIVVVDRTGCIVQVNQQTERLYGYTREELLQADHDVLVPERYRKKHRKNSRKYMSEPHIRHMGTGLDLFGRRKDGSEFPVDIALGPLQMKDDAVVLAVVRDFTERKRLEAELERSREYLEDMVRERTAELESKNFVMQELNATLKTLLKQREDDKKEMEERFVMNVRNLVLPYIEQMKRGRLDVGQRSSLDMIHTHLHEIATPLLQNIRKFNLTPRELQVAALVRQGRSTKEIAEILGTASGSINIHRKHIREKLGLGRRKTSLQSYLASIDE